MERKRIDAGGNPAVRHEGVPPSNNLIKDGTHRATVFVGPTLKSFPFLFSRRFNRGLYGGEGYEHQENSQRDRNIRGCGRGIHGRRGTMDEGSEQEVSNGTGQTDTPEVRQNHIRRLQEGKEEPLTQRLFPFFIRTKGRLLYGDKIF